LRKYLLIVLRQIRWLLLLESFVDPRFQGTVYRAANCRIRTSYGPENINRLRRFGIGLIKSKGGPSVAQKMANSTKILAWSSTTCA
jgi:hypothetical protein